MRNSQLFHEMIVSKSYTKDMEEQQILQRKALVCRLNYKGELFWEPDDQWERDSKNR